MTDLLVPYVIGRLMPTGGGIVLVAAAVVGALVWVARSTSALERVASVPRLRMDPRPTQTRRERACGAALAVGLLLAVCGGVVWVGTGPSTVAAAATAAPVALPAVMGEVLEADSAPTATRAPTATVAPLPAVPAASKRLLSIFGGECLSASNPDYRGNARATVEARWRHCLPKMTAAADQVGAEVEQAQRIRTVMAYAAPIGTVLSDAEVRARLTPAERAKWRKQDAAAEQYAADRAVLDRAAAAVQSALGGYWFP